MHNQYTMFPSLFIRQLPWVSLKSFSETRLRSEMQYASLPILAMRFKFKIQLPVNDRINHNLDWICISKQMNNFHSMFNYADSHKLLSIVPAMHHQRIGKSFNNWALSLAEPLSRISSSSMRKVCSMFWRSHSDVISKRHVTDLELAED